jgi:prepilin-type N-terminal cleavage/methylation domain-containing protein
MYRTLTRRLEGRGERGYTLTELAVVMAVFMIFMSFAGPVMISHLMSAVRTERRVDLQQSARAALRTMERELRQAVELYDEVSKPGKPTGKNLLSFGVDLDGDGTIVNLSNSGTEQITYYVKNGTLYRGWAWNQGVPLAENVLSLQYTYFGSNPLLDTDSDGVVEESELNPPDGLGPWSKGELANVTRVVIVLTVEESGVTQTYSSDVLLRNKVVG